MGCRCILSAKYLTNIRDIQWLDKDWNYNDEKAVKNCHYIQLWILMLLFDTPFPNIFMILQVWPHLRFQANVFANSLFHIVHMLLQSVWSELIGYHFIAIGLLVSGPLLSVGLLNGTSIFRLIFWSNLLSSISPLQSAYLHRQQFWHKMNQNVEIGSLPICFNLLDNLFVFV